MNLESRSFSNITKFEWKPAKDEIGMVGILVVEELHLGGELVCYETSVDLIMVLEIGKNKIEENRQTKKAWSSSLKRAISFIEI